MLIEKEWKSHEIQLFQYLKQNNSTLKHVFIFYFMTISLHLSSYFQYFTWWKNVKFILLLWIDINISRG